MKRNATVVCLREVGKPRVETWELPEPQPHQVLVEPLASPINPADLNVVEGTYPIRPNLPAVAGNEGVGIIAGDQHVIAPTRPGWWCSARVMDAEDLYAVPAEIPRDTAAMLTVNPPTAYRMLHDFVSLKPGDWIIQNAANSAVGRCVIQFARLKGWRTVNVVRRKELIPELQAEGADVVLTDETPVSRQLGGLEVRLGLNAVGGESARQIAKALASGGTLVTYGAMAREPMRIENGLLIFKDIRFRGFWISDWYRRATRTHIEEMFAELFPLAKDGKLRAPVEKTYPLAQAQEAIAHARKSERAGKILFVMRFR